MDAPDEEQDVKLQRYSPELLADFESSLQPFLWRKLPDGGLKIRKKVRTRDTDRLIGLLSPHQESPQLLDAHLEKFLLPLSDAFLESLKTTQPSREATTGTALLIPLTEAVCKLLYTFCKIRGEKVIVRFFSAEPKYLELLLSTIETADDSPTSDSTAGGISSAKRSWSWEERYITILWLSHLLLAPFDLASISSADAKVSEPSIPKMNWPTNLPGVACRVVPIAIKYLASAGKERDAAKALLVRISMRKDMQELGLLHALIDWVLLSLQSSTSPANNSPYYFIGILSYLGGILAASMSTSDMDSYLPAVFVRVQTVSDPDNLIFQIIHTSALARKTVIKVMRSVVVLVLRPQYSTDYVIVQTAIEHMMVALADNDTPVRLAASKALSVITLKLPQSYAADVVAAVLSALEENVLGTGIDVNGTDKGQDLSRVDPLEWHGLILTLSHLLYRRSPPANSLSNILRALLIGLSFEQRSTSGNSIGTNVRDAACFGIWAVARRYSTDELKAVDNSTIVQSSYIDYPDGQYPEASMIEILATELVVSASLDPAGNIRRGASAALQELIGRHPNVVPNGIEVVQVVDYHSVALRSRAMLEVAPQSARLSYHNENAILCGLLDWRGAGDTATATRRISGAAVGYLVQGFPAQQVIPPLIGLDSNAKFQQRLGPWTKVSSLIQYIHHKLIDTSNRDVERLHGLHLSLSDVVTALPGLLTPEDYNACAIYPVLALQTTPDYYNTEKLDQTSEEIAQVMTLIQETVFPIIDPFTKDSTWVGHNVTRAPDLVAEGICRLISAVCPVLWGDLNYDEWIKGWILNYPPTSREESCAAFLANRFSIQQWRLKSGIDNSNEMVSSIASYGFPNNNYISSPIPKSPSVPQSQSTLKTSLLLAPRMLAEMNQKLAKEEERFQGMLRALLDNPTEIDGQKKRLDIERQHNTMKAMIRNSFSYTLRNAVLVEVPLRPGSSHRKMRFITALAVLTTWFQKCDKEAITAATGAAMELVKICTPEFRKEIVNTWISSTVSPSLLFTLTKASPLLESIQIREICDTILVLWMRAKTVQARVLLLQSITSSPILVSNADRFIDMVSEGLDDYTTDGRGDVGSLVRIEALKATCHLFESISWENSDSTAAIADNWAMNLSHFRILVGKVLRLAAEKLDKVRAEARTCVAKLYCDKGPSSLSCQEILAEDNSFISTSQYFTKLLDLQTNNWLNIPSSKYRPYEWRLDIFEGLVSSADGGSEDLIRASRTGLVHFCERSRYNETDGIELHSSKERRNYVGRALYELAKKHETNDRVLVPALEIISFLFDMGIMQKCEFPWKDLYFLVQSAHRGSANMRKLDACVKLYGGLVQVHPKAMEKLTSMLLHRYPQVRNRAADVIFASSGVGKGVNWLHAKKDDLSILRAQLAALHMYNQV